jgi:hypothetical protein
MIGPKFVTDRLNNVGPSNSYYFEIAKSDGTAGGMDAGVDLAEPPVKVLIDFAQDFTNPELQELVTKYSIQNRTVKIFCATQKKIVTKNEKDEDVVTYEENEPFEIGSIAINSLNINWDIYQPFKQHPLALKGLMDICMAHHLGNLLPSQN